MFRGKCDLLNDQSPRDSVAQKELSLDIFSFPTVKCAVPFPRSDRPTETNLTTDHSTGTTIFRKTFCGKKPKTSNERPITARSTARPLEASTAWGNRLIRRFRGIARRAAQIRGEGPSERKSVNRRADHRATLELARKTSSGGVCEKDRTNHDREGAGWGALSWRQLIHELCTKGCVRISRMVLNRL